MARSRTRCRTWETTVPSRRTSPRNRSGNPSALRLEQKHTTNDLHEVANERVKVVPIVLVVTRQPEQRRAGPGPNRALRCQAMQQLLPPVPEQRQSVKALGRIAEDAYKMQLQVPSETHSHTEIYGMRFVHSAACQACRGPTANIGNDSRLRIQRGVRLDTSRLKVGRI